MFKKIGTPVLVDEVINFDPAKAEAVKCDCGTIVGHRSAGLFKAAGASKVVTAGTPVQCPACGETTHV
jgi:hypothetical protein